MAKVKEEQSSQQTKQVLAFSTRYAMTLRKPAGNWMREKDKRMSQSVRRWKHG